MRWLLRFCPANMPGGVEGRPATQRMARPLKLSVSKACETPLFMQIELAARSAALARSGPAEPFLEGDLGLMEAR